MISWGNSNNKTIVGYIEKSKNKATLISSKYTLESTKDISPFVLTRDMYFDIDNIEKYAKNEEKRNLFHRIKRQIANILILPGLFVALLYLLEYIGLTNRVHIVETFFDLPILDSFFWLSLVGVFILLHDYFKIEQDNVDQLPIVLNFPQIELDEINEEGINFGRYAHSSISKYLDLSILDILEGEKGKIDISKLLSSIISEDVTSEVLKRSDISKEELKEITFGAIDTKSKSMFLAYILEEALLTSSSKILPVHILLAILKIFPLGQKFLLDKKNMSISIVREAVSFVLHKKRRKGSNGYSFANTYIYEDLGTLNSISKNINEISANSSEIYGIGHDSEINDMILTLSKERKRNVLLLGDSGVGKTDLVYAIADRINQKNISPQLIDKRIVGIKIQELSQYGRRAIKKSIKGFLDQVADSKQTIIFIDDLEELFNEENTIAQIFVPYILEDKITVIGTTNYMQYQKHFYTNEQLRMCFENIEITKISALEGLDILREKIFSLENSYKVYISIPAIISSIDYAQRYITQRSLPGSAVSLLEKVCIWGNKNNVKIILSDHIAKVVSFETNSSVEELDNEESERTASLEEKVSTNVYGQEEQIQLISQGIKSATTKKDNEIKPDGVFLVIGNDGSGREYLIKNFVKNYYENEKALIAIDMNDFAEKPDSFIDPSENTALEEIHTNPYCGLMIKNIESAQNETIVDLVSSIQQGEIIEKNGKPISISNSLIFFTTTIGGDILINEEDNTWEEKKNKVMMMIKQKISQNLLEILDGIVIMKPPSLDNAVLIVTSILEKFKEELKEKNISLIWDNTIPMLIANKGYVFTEGTKSIERYIKEKIIGNITQDVVTKELEDGDKVRIKESWIV